MEHIATRFSKFISYVFHPIFLPFYSVILFYLFGKEPFFFSYLDPKVLKALGFIILLYSLVFPLFMVYLLRKMGHIGADLENMTVTDRNKILILITGIYSAFAYFLYSKGNLLRPLSYLYVVYSVNLLGNLILNKFLKISLHVSGISCVLGLSFYLMYYYDLENLNAVVYFLLILAGVIGSARLFLAAHNPKEIYLAYFWGIFSGIFTAFLIF